MKDVFVIADNIVSPLGFTSTENFSQLRKSVSGIRWQENVSLSPNPFFASLFNQDQFPEYPNQAKYSRFEQILITSIADAIDQSGLDTADHKTILILSSTKGNISLLETGKMDEAVRHRIGLPASAELIGAHFRFRHPPIIVSHACISGMLAVITGLRLIRSGKYDHAVIAGADVISKFILSGFQSFMAISPEPCKPFDANRNGITLGEAAGTLILSTGRKKGEPAIRVESGSVSNDANHISGPSRTGKELFFAIRNAMDEASISAKEIDFISAHGTATLYNDEMEANAVSLAGLESVPLNSLKGYYGHTLGAAGLVESIISMHSLRESVFLPTLGFKTPGTSKPVNVSREIQNGSFRKCLKTASGFGGCNAALVFSRE
jgi:3-oxoacyl-[acyl-carrier-protein] synthase I